MRAPLIAGAAALALAGLAAALVSQAGTPPPLGGAEGDVLDAFGRRIGALEARLARLEGERAAAAVTAPERSAAAATAPATTPVAGADQGPRADAEAAAGAEADAGADTARPGRAGRAADPARALAATVETLRRRLARLESAAPTEDLAALSADELAQRGAEAMEANQAARGTRYLEALLARDPAHVKAGDAHLQLGMRVEDPAAAIAHYETLAERHPDHGWAPFARFYIGQREEQRKDPAAAYRAYEAALRTADDNPFFGIWARVQMAKIAETDRQDPTTAERLRRDALARHGTCQWTTVTAALKELRAKLGLPEPPPAGAPAGG